MAFVRAYTRNLGWPSWIRYVGNKILCLGHYSLDKTNLYAVPDDDHARKKMDGSECWLS